MKREETKDVPENIKHYEHSRRGNLKPRPSDAIFSWPLESKVCAGQKLRLVLGGALHRHPPLDRPSGPEACEGELKG